jgi:hypothetical protein
MFTKTAYALIAVLLLSSAPATAMEEGGASAYAIPRNIDAHTAGKQNRFVSGTQAYASAGRNHLIRQQPRNMRPFTNEEAIWFRTAQGYEDQF